MKKGIKIFFIILGVIILFGIIFLVVDSKIVQNENKQNIQPIDENKQNIQQISDNMKVKKEAVILKVNQNNLLVMEKNNEKTLYTVGISNEENSNFKPYQEILIYFDGTVLTIYPGQLENVGKIEIIKEKSEIEIPKKILRYCYSSKENISVSINEITSYNLSFNIKDFNKYPYEYSNQYTLSKKVKNENYTGVGQKIGETTENSTAGFTRNWFRI